MKHPTPEEMMDHLYGERPPAQKAEFEAHLRACDDCRTQVAGWRKTMATLDTWRLPAQRTVSLRLTQPALRWAAAAVVLISVVGASFVAGRGAGGPRNLEALQAALHQEVTTQVAAQVAAAMNRERSTLVAELRAAATATATEETRQQLAAFAEQLDERRQADAEVYYTAIEQVNARNAEYLSRLRRDLSTVALVADARLTDTQEQLQQLTDPLQ
jgi:anti-sigma factor RsiW